MKKLIFLFVAFSLCGSMVAVASDEASLNQAINSLNARAKTDADKKLVLKAVSQQTRLPEKTLRSQMGATHLNYGELLAANSIAEGSGKNLNAVLTMKGGKSWASVSKQLRVDPYGIVDRLHNCREDHPGRSRFVTRSKCPRRSTWWTGKRLWSPGRRPYGSGFFNAWPSVMAKR